MWLFISKIKNLNFCICQNTHFCCSGLGQESSWWINSIFCVGKVSIWRCLLMLTFSGLYFLFYKYPMNFQQGLVQPPVDWKWPKRITVPCVDSFYTLSVDKNRHFLTPSPSSCPRSYWMPPNTNFQICSRLAIRIFQIISYFCSKLFIFLQKSISICMPGFDN